MTSLSTALNTLPTVTPTKDHAVPVVAGGPAGKATIAAVAAVVQTLLTGGAGSGAVGASLLTGASSPSSSDGVDGSVWINTTTWDVSKRFGTTWSVIGNIKGAPGATGAPGTGGGGSATVDSATIINALTFTPAAVTGSNLGSNAPTFRANVGLTEQDLPPNTVLGVNATGDLVPIPTVTIDAGNPALAGSDDDLYWTAQPSRASGNSLVAQSNAGLLAYLLTKQLPTTGISANTTLSAAHNNRTLVCTTALTVSLPATFLGDGFRCHIINAAALGQSVTIDAAVNIAGGNIVGPNKHCFMDATAVGGNRYFGVIPGQGSSSTAIALSNISNQTGTVSFTVSGFLSGYSVAPSLQYQDNSGSFVNLPVGSTVTATTFSFTHPGMSTSTGNTITVKDTSGVTTPAISNSFDVTAASGATIAAKAPASQPFVAPGGTTASVTLTADLSGYGVAPTLTYSLVGGTTFAALPGTPTVTTTSVQFTVTGIPAGAYNFLLKDQNGVVSNVVPFSVERAVLSSVPTTGFTGNFVAGAGATLTGITTAYAVLYTGGADQGSRRSFTGSVVPSISPTASGSYTLRVYDAFTSGNLLAESATITVSDPTIAVATPGTTSPSSTMTLTGTYTGPAPSGVNARFDSTGSYTALTSFSATGGSWTGQITSPSSGGSHTVQVQEANATGITATSGSFTAGTAFPTAPSGATLQLAISADTAANSLYSDTGTATVANAGDAVNSIKDLANSYVFARSGAGSGPTLTAAQQNGLPGLVCSGGATRGLVCTNTTLLAALKGNFVTAAMVAKWSISQSARLFLAGQTPSLENNSMIITPHSSNANIVSTWRNGNTANQLATTATAFANKRLILINRFPQGVAGLLKCDGKMDSTAISGSLTLAGSDNASAWDVMTLFRARLGNGADSNFGFQGSLFALFVWSHPSQYASDAEVTTIISDLTAKWG